MTQLEYLTALISIIVALGLTDLAQSLRDLVRPDHRVRWHPLPLLWAAVTLLLIVQIWWGSFEALQMEVFSQAWVFLAYLLMFLVLYLACAFSLPDPDWHGGADRSDPEVLDLHAFYFSAAHRRWFFGTLLVLIVLAEAFTQTVFVPENRIRTLSLNATGVVTLGVLMGTDRAWVHWVITALAFVTVLVSTATRQLI